MFKVGSLVRIAASARSSNAGNLVVIIGDTGSSYRVVIIDTFETRGAFYAKRWLDGNATTELICATPSEAAVFAQTSDAKGYYCLAKVVGAKVPKRKHQDLDDAQAEAIRLSKEIEAPVEVLAIMGTATPKLFVL